MSVILRTKKLSKYYPGTQALKSVDYEVYKNKVNVLVGENGAGKSTMMNILSGANTPTMGDIILEEKEVVFKNIRDAEKEGIRIIFQELNLYQELSVLDNLFMGHEITNGVKSIDYTQQKMKGQEALSKLDLDIDIQKKVYELSMGEQQFVEITRCLMGEAPKILIMDEPTSSLSQKEVDKLFAVIDNLKKNGVTIIYISHRLEELIHIGDYITVFRDGEMISSEEIKNIDTKWIIRNMIGENHDLFQYQKKHIDNTPILQVKNLNVVDSYGTQKLYNCNFECMKGEVLGIYGLLGSGRTELLHTIIGQLKVLSGNIVFQNQEITQQKVSKIIRQGIAIVTEDRKGSGIIPSMNIKDNANLTSCKRMLYDSLILRLLYCISSALENTLISKMFKVLTVKFSDYKDLITALSGGNQQKVIVSRALLSEPKVLLLDEPTRGVDIHAKSDIYSIINTFSSSGTSIIYTTSELNEAMEVSDRLLVMASGRITGILKREEYSHEKIVELSTPNKGDIYE